METKKPFVDVVFDLAREAVVNHGDNRVWLIDAINNKKSFVKDIEPQSRKIAAAFQQKVPK